VLVVHNLGGEPADATIPTPGTTSEVVFADPGTSLVRDGSGWRARLPARSSAFWRVR
jgi:hypothetical protein